MKTDRNYLKEMNYIDRAFFQILDELFIRYNYEIKIIGYLDQLSEVRF